MPIGEWVLRQACCGTLPAWPGELQRRGQSVAGAVQEPRPRCHGRRGACARPGWPPARLELEITETVLLQDTEATLATLHELRELGVRIAMDDFGTGYSSLSYLRRFPFDRIKIDQSFVRELGKQHDCGAIIRAVIALSHELGMATTAEGVETERAARGPRAGGVLRHPGLPVQPAGARRGGCGGHRDPDRRAQGTLHHPAARAGGLTWNFIPRSKNNVAVQYTPKCVSLLRTRA